MIFVEKITWLDKGAREAEVTLSDTTFRCRVFCHPCHFFQGDLVEQPLQAFEECHVVRVPPQEVILVKAASPDGWAYEVIGLVNDLTQNQIQVGDFKINLNSLPGDVGVGDCISCLVSRLDLW